jgi:hypothetical protein
MQSFQITIRPQQDIAAALREGLKECGSLKATRRTWARLIEALGVDVYFHYLRRMENEEQHSLGNAAIAIINESMGNDEVSVDPDATLNICENVVEFTTPNGVIVNLTADGPQGLIVAVHFNRESAFLATMMLAGFARRVPAAYPLLAEAATELAATHRQ